MNKKSILVLGMIALAVFSFAEPASAAETMTDDTNDVLHWSWNDNLGTYSWSHSVANKPSIDITELSFTVDGEQAILKMEVSGSIEDSENVVYGAYYNTTDAIYYMTCANGSGMCMGVSNDYNQVSYGNVSVSGSTITAEANVVGTGARSDFYGYAYKYTHLGDTNAEWWGDWIPQDTSPWSGDTDLDDRSDESGGGIPGFEGIAVLASLLIAVGIITISGKRMRK